MWSVDFLLLLSSYTLFVLSSQSITSSSPSSICSYDFKVYVYPLPPDLPSVVGYLFLFYLRESEICIRSKKKSFISCLRWVHLCKFSLSTCLIVLRNNSHWSLLFMIFLHNFVVVLKILKKLTIFIFLLSVMSLCSLSFYDLFLR